MYTYTHTHIYIYIYMQPNNIVGNFSGPFTREYNLGYGFELSILTPLDSALGLGLASELQKPTYTFNLASR